MDKEERFQGIYEEFRPIVIRYLTRLAGPAEAEDLTQEVFAKIARSIGNFEGRSSLSTWIYRIATNTALDSLRSKGPKTIDEKASYGDDSGPDIEDINVWSGKKAEPLDRQLIRKEMNTCIRGVVEKLPGDYRTVIILSEFEGLKNREIAKILNISLDSVKVRLHRAKAKLKTELENKCSFYKDELNVLACDRKEPAVITFRQK